MIGLTREQPYTFALYILTHNSNIFKKTYSVLHGYMYTVGVLSLCVLVVVNNMSQYVTVQANF